MHGISPQQFAESVSSFLVPFYIALAAMNGIAALLMWRKFGPVTYFRTPGIRFPVTNALVWTIVALAFAVLSAMAAGRNLAMMPKMPESFREFVNSQTGPVIYTLGTTTLLIILFLFRSWFVKPAIAWSIWNL